MALLSDVIRRGTRASQPAAAAVAAGTLYCVTDESNIIERSTASAWESYSPSAPVAATAAASVWLPDGVDGTEPMMFPPGLPAVAATTSTGVLGITLDGGGSAITTGVKGDLYVPFACTITAVTMLADQSGSIVVDIWKDTYANYPPTVADTITAAAKPTISTATKSQDSTLTGWTTSVSAGDTLRFNVDSAATVTRVTLTLTVTK